MDQELDEIKKAIEKNKADIQVLQSKKLVNQFNTIHGKQIFENSSSNAYLRYALAKRFAQGPS